MSIKSSSFIIIIAFNSQLSIYLSIPSNQSLNIKYVPGHKVQAEEADQIIRECKPLPDEDSRFDESIARIYFGQYLAMLVDESLV